MLATSDPDRIDIAFDDDRLVADAGLLLPATLAQHLGLQELADSCVDLGDAPGRANAGDKLLTLVASALAGGDCIDDAAALRAGGAGRVLGCTVKAPSTLGTFLRSFSWGHVRQLDRLSRELLARAGRPGRDPATAPLTIDLDSTICETYGLAKEGARHHGYTGVRGYHPLLAVAAGTGEVLMARLREGRANTARGAAHFLRETVGRVRDAGARRAHGARRQRLLQPRRRRRCRQDVRFSITIRQQPNVRRLIEAIAEEDWTPIPYWLAGRRRCRRDDLHAVPAQGGRHRGAAHRAARQADARLTARALHQLQLPRATARGSCWSWRPIGASIAGTPRSRTRSATSSTASGSGSSSAWSRADGF